MNVEYEILWQHMKHCVQCSRAFSLYKDDEYCDLGQRLFRIWHESK